jgi:Carboxypeptidase regulatory-like domain/TonB-dependent Receptor Plug Domain
MSICRHHVAWGLALLLTGAASSVGAQETTGTIIGTVADQGGSVLPGVNVTLRDAATGRTFSRETAEAGFYTAPFLPVGDYDVTFTLAGFQPLTVRGIRVSVNDRLVVDARLSVSGVTETLLVAGRAVQPTAALQYLVDSARVHELPLNNRNFAQLMTLIPGVSSDLADEVGVGLTSLMSISINGARRSAVNWMVDGISNVDAGSNISLLSTPTLESIEEFKVITNGYAAEWPRSGGGVVNVVTKSGSSRFAGTAYEFLRNDALNANSFFRNQSTDRAVASNPPFLRYNNFGYTLGGPVPPWQGKFFFFWSQEWRRIKRAPASLVATVPNPEWLTDPTSANYVPIGERDANAVRLLQLWPAPNLTPLTPGAAGRYEVSSPNINDTRQEVIRLDYDVNPRWRITGRFTHDVSQTQELGGLFFGTPVPHVATTDTDVPGVVASLNVKTVFTNARLNELQYQFSGNNIKTANPKGTLNRKADLGLTISEVFPENAAGLMPVVSVTGLSIIGANQLYQIQYVNHTIADTMSWQRGTHLNKLGGLVTFEQKNENAAGRSQGAFTFVATSGGPTAFQSFLRGNRNASCAACTYVEAEHDVDLNLRFNRFEFYGQDTWRLAPQVTLDYGVRYSLYPPVTERDDLLATFDPQFFTVAEAPPFANAAGTLIDRTKGDVLAGILRAGVNSPFGRSIYGFKKNSLQPRVGVAWSPSGNGNHVVRAAFGVYYDQPAVGIFEDDAFTTPPIVNSVTLTNPDLSHPATGQTSNTSGVRGIIASSTKFDNPRTLQWNVGLTRRFFDRAVVEVTYVGSRGDHLIRPTDINYPQPSDVVALQEAVTDAVNPARPFRSYGAITFRETTGKARYHGLLTGLHLENGRSGSLTANYTLSRNQTDASNDRDGVDIPQNPRDPGANYADARTDRRHIFAASYVYELPLVAGQAAVLNAVITGWQVAGIVNIASGQPVPRITVLSNNFRRGGLADRVGDSHQGERFVNGVPYWFNPDAFAPPADGTFGNSGRSPFRQPGRHQWDLAVSKNVLMRDGVRIQLRADFINAFNQTQWLSDPVATGLDNTCTQAIGACNVAGDRFGQLLLTRAPREVQLGLKVVF